MGDQYDAAQTQINQNKAAILAAMAAQGTQGKAYYDSTQADLAAQRSNAVNAALQEAQNRGAPANMLASIQSQIEAPYTRQSMNVNNGAIAEQTWRNNLGDATANYMDQSSAAIPGLRIIAQTKAAEAKAKASLQAQKDAASLARTNASASRARSGSSRSSGAPKFSSALANAATKAATASHRTNVASDAGHQGTAFGPRAHAQLDAITGAAKNLGEAVAILTSGLPGAKDDAGKPLAPLYWKSKPVAGLLDYNAMLAWLQNYYGSPSQDELDAAQQQVLGAGTY